MGGAGPITAVFVTAAIVFASLIKGAIAFGFPTIATPLLALVIDVKTAVAITIVPNIVMDTIQVGRRGHFFLTVRRFAPLFLFGVVGMVLGTRLLAVLPPRTATLVLGAFLLSFVVVNVSRFSPRVPPGWEPWLSPPVGLVGGIIGGVTNVPGTPLVIYFYALRLEKYEFVRSVALAFMTYKVIQLGATAYYGLLTWRLLAISVGLTAVGLVAFAVGLRVQDRLDEKVFNRLVLVFLSVVGVWLTLRGLR